MPKLVIINIGTNDLGFAFVNSATQGEDDVLAQVDPVVDRCADRLANQGTAGDQCQGCGAVLSLQGRIQLPNPA